MELDLQKLDEQTIGALKRAGQLNEIPNSVYERVLTLGVVRSNARSGVESSQTRLNEQGAWVVELDDDQVQNANQFYRLDGLSGGIIQPEKI